MEKTLLLQTIREEAYRSRHPATADLDLRICKLSGRGKTAMQIAMEIPCSESTVYRALRRVQNFVSTQNYDRFLQIGCIAFRTPHGPPLVTLKQKLIAMIGFGPVELITISRPQAYLEYAPYHIVATEDEFIRAVIKLYESAKVYSCNAEDAMRKEMLAVEEDWAMGRCGISLVELGRRLGTILGEVVL